MKSILGIWRIRGAFGGYFEDPYKASVEAFRVDGGGREMKREHRAKGERGVLSEVLEDADKRSKGINVSPSRKKLLEMVRLLHRKQQKVFDDLSPTRRETLRMMAEFMLDVDSHEKNRE